MAEDQFTKKDCDELTELTAMRSVAEPWLEAINEGDLRGARVWKHKANKIMEENLKDRNLAQEIRDWIDNEVSDTFTPQDVYKRFHLSTRPETQAASKVFTRLRDKKVIEKGRGSTWIKINEELIPIQWWKPKKRTYDIVLPLGIHEVARIFPKNIIVISGTSNAGKSAFCLATAILNMDTYEINYFNNEMAEEEFGDRIDLCDFSEEQMTTFKERVKVWERVSKYEQVVDPNGFNIIDYLTTPADKAYLMKDAIEVVSDKLEKGIALIAIHKKKDDDHGYGGVYTMNRPRLYVSINHGLAKLVKVKAWQKGIANPNGKLMQFKLHDGWSFSPQTAWYHEDEIETADKKNKW